MYVQFDIDILSLLLLGIVLFNHIKNSSEGLLRQRFFHALIYCDMGILIMDIMIFIAIGNPGEFIHILLQILQTVFFMLCSLFCMLWVLYYTVRPGNKPRRYEMALLTVPFILLVIFLGFNFAYHFIFRITAENGYQRGPLFLIIAVCTYSYIVYLVMQVWSNKRHLSSSEFYTYLIIPLFPMAVGIVQLILKAEVLMVWPATTLSMVIMQMSTLTEKINLDHLTGLYNRKYLDEYIEDALQMSRAGNYVKGSKKFAAIMLDLDNFKKINDSFGHVEGDRAIVIAADLLRKSIRKGDFVSRYGGDEFLIVLEQCSDSTPLRVIRRIRENAQKFNNENSLPYVIEFSMGYKVYSNLIGLTSKQIFSDIDELMYQNKQSKIGAHI
jgi:diguanylate cyclase (GGDEF)-like protein